MTYGKQQLRLKLFARLKSNCFAGRDVRDLARAGVAPDAALAGLDDKHAEAAQLYALATLKRVLHSFKQRLDRDFGFYLRDACLVGDRVHYIELYHFSLRLAFEPMRADLGKAVIIGSNREIVKKARSNYAASTAAVFVTPVSL
jgi:hypothetical protein